jgi:hypothetical protein
LLRPPGQCPAIHAIRICRSGGDAIRETTGHSRCVSVARFRSGGRRRRARPGARSARFPSLEMLERWNCLRIRQTSPIRMDRFGMSVGMWPCRRSSFCSLAYSKLRQRPVQSERRNVLKQVCNSSGPPALTCVNSGGRMRWKVVAEGRTVLPVIRCSGFGSPVPICPSAQLPRQ